MDKKKIIIVVIIFLLLGTMVFSFANPRTDEGKLNGDDSSLIDDKPDDEKDDEQDDEQDEQQDDQQDEQQDNQQGNQQDDMPVSGNVNIDYLALAKQAVAKAETSFLVVDIESAKEAINKVTDKDAKEELLDRVNNVSNILDFEKLLKELENKTNNSTNKNELNAARTYNIDNDLANKLKNLVDVNNNKVTLQTRYDNVLVKLNDTSIQEISGINDGEFTNKVVNITIADNSSFTAKLNGENYISGTDIRAEGNYTLTVTDSSFNDATINFTIDTTIPTFNYTNGKIVKEGTLVFDDANFDYIKLYNHITKETETIYANEFVFNGNISVDNLRYDITGCDKAGNCTSTFNLYHDTDKPEVSGTAKIGSKEVKFKNGGTYKEVTLNITDGSLKEVILLNNDEVLKTFKDNFNSSIKMEFEHTSKEDGNYKIKAIDRAGNFEIIEFTIDNQKPIVKGIKDGGYYQSVVITVDDTSELGSMHFKRNGEKYNYELGEELDEEGNYSFYITDVAGNKSEVINFVIDNSPADYNAVNFNVVGGYNDGNYYYATFGDVIYAHIITNEILKENPTFTLTIGNEKIVLDGDKVNFKDEEKEEYTYLYSIKYELPEEEKFKNLQNVEVKLEISNVVDKAGNVTLDKKTQQEVINIINSNKVFIDTTAPEKSGLVILGGNYNEEDNTRYANENTNIYVYAIFNEKLGTVPTVKIDGKEYVMDTLFEDNGTYRYYSKNIKGIDLEEGLVEFEVYGYKDTVGNEGVLLNNNDITEAAQSRVIVDKTDPLANPLYILNVSDAINRKLIKDGQILRVEANFNEELLELPILNVGKQSIEFKKCNFNQAGTLYVCVADLKLDNSIAKLPEGEIKFTVSNIKDLAGNPITLNNDNVTYTDDYGQVEFDSTAPEYKSLGVYNLTNFRINENLNYAKIGDQIRVMVYFEEKLAVEPTITINGLKFTATYREDSSSANNYAYYADITLTNEMNLNLLNEIEFTVSNYQDTIGNVGKILNNKNINSKKYTKVSLVDNNIVLIEDNEDLINAIKNQQDGQTLVITKEGTYDVSQNGSGFMITEENKINNEFGEFAFPIYANNFKITKADGIGEVILTSSFTPSKSEGGVWRFQNFITVKGNNVTIENVSLKANRNDYYGTCNKVIELIDGGKNLTIKNVDIIPLENDEGTSFGGSIYLNVADAGNTLIENVNMDAWINAKAVTAGTVTINNLTQDFSNSEYSGYYPGVSGSYEGIKVNDLTIVVGKTINLKEQIFNENLRPGTTIVLADNITIDETIEINETVTIDGNNKTISGKEITNTNTIIGFLVNEGTATFKNLTLTDFDENLTAPHGSVIKIDAGHDNAKVIANNVRISDFARDAFTFKAGTFEVVNSYIDCKPNENRVGQLTKGFQIGFSESKVSGVIENTDIVNSSSNYEDWSTAAIEIYNNANVQIIGGTISNTETGIQLDHYWPGSESYSQFIGDATVTVDGVTIDAGNNAILLYSREGATDNYTITINSGNFTGDVDFVNKTENDSIIINGGNFNGNISSDVIKKED